MLEELKKVIKDGKIINAYCKESFCKKTLTEKEFNFVNNIFGDTFGQKFYNLFNNITEPPKCICGNNVKFKSYAIGYQKYCCNSCKAKDQKHDPNQYVKMVETSKKVFIEKYGVDSPFKLKKVIDSVKSRDTEWYLNRLEKTKSTNLERYGETHPLKNNEIATKVKSTNIEKYENASSLHGKNQNKIKDIIDKKYGLNEVQKKASKIASNTRWESHYNILLNFCKQNNIEIVDFDVKNSKNIFKCKTCETTFHRINGFPICPRCNLKNKFHSKAEKEIVEFVKSIYTGKIYENDRLFLKGKELDIYLPDLKLAIEYNGSYWHGYNKHTDISISDFKKKTEEKRLLCRDKGVRLITIDEHDYLSNKAVFNRFFEDLILPRRRIFARKCIITDINDIDAKKFCDYYHVNGYRGGSYKYGVYYNNELICVAIFAKYKTDYECVRLCYKTGVDIIGGWAKIQKHFGKRFLHYVNLKYFDGENKTGVGFRFLLPNGLILHRNSLQKKTGLYKYCKTINKDLSDFQNCLLNNMIAIFDLGNDVRWYN